MNTAILQAVTAALAGMDPAQLANLRKDWTSPASAIQGINYYDLEAPAKQLYPVITPLRNRIARVKAVGGTQANWRAVTGVNTQNTRAGVSEGKRGGVIQTSTANYIAAYLPYGLEDWVSFEADLAATGFQDVKALAVLGLLNSLMIQEEIIMLGGNNSLALGTTPTPTTSTATTGGTIAAATYDVKVVALSLEGYLASSVSASGVPGVVTRTNADQSTDTYGGGSAIQSVAATQATTGSTSTVSATVTPVAGAFAYAWYIGTAGASKIAAITTINSVTITALPSGSNQAASAITTPATDASQNLLEFDGILTMASKSSLNGYIKVQPTGTAGVGTPLTADTAGGIVEIDTALRWFWDNYRLSPTDIYVSAQEMNSLGKLILTGTSTMAHRFSFIYDKQGVLAGGIMVKSYLNKFGMNGAQEIPIHLHPNLPPGTILFFTDKLPYPLSNVTNILQMKMRREYYQVEWPLRTRKYEYGVYADGVLQNYFPPAFGIITNIAPTP
jgi:hypothetical protein